MLAIDRNENMNIIVDAMGGDNAPEEIVKGCIMAANDFGEIITLVGKKDIISEHLKKAGYNGDRIKIQNAEEVISGDDEPTTAIRQKKDSSLRVGLDMLHKGQGDVMVSAGNTGALITGATLIVKRIKGVRRVALAPLMPAETGCFLLVDGGANVESSTAFLKQFAIMGSIYMEKIMHIKNPRVGLVNIGSEEEKGTEDVTEANRLLKEIPINYTGYIEGREIPCGAVDVVVCDGFTGNVILKFMEGMGIVIKRMLKGIFFKNLKTKIAALMVKGGINELGKTLDYTEYGGAPLLGCTKPVVKAHGSSNAKAFYHAIRQSIDMVNNNLVDTISENINKY